MKNFSLSFLGKEFNYENEMVNRAKISIGNFFEEMNIPLSYWNKEDYKRQWSKAIYDLLTEKKDTALITKMYNPEYANFLELWVLYLDNEIIHIQNIYLFLDELEKKFDEKDFYSLIHKRECVTEEGEKISEWDININDIKEFYEEIKNNQY